MSDPGESPAVRARVLWVIKGLGPGGAEQLLVSSARVADHDRFAYRAAYVRRDKAQLVSRLASSGVPALLLGSGRFGAIIWPLRLRRIMKDTDVVHAHSPLVAGVTRLVARTLPRHRRPVTVSTEHNVWGNFSAPTRILNAVTCGLDARRWAVSREVRRSMWRPLRGRAEVLVHGIVQSDANPPGGTRERVRGELGISDDAVVAITVANLRREKDYPNLLRAASLVLRRDPSIVMIAVGQGPLVDEVHALHRELGLGERFKLLGYRTDVPDLLAASDLFVLASAFEGLPVSIMEAMAAGLPVVATSVGGVPEVVVEEETGLLVRPGDSDALADAVLALAQDAPLRLKLGARAAERSQAFDIRAAIHEQQRAYAALARR
ncbi:glycosyltransferase involved in cell wall biosynthesis [Humibacillus xanthopallidus]|uniref:Glycosyltransferase involved in cell wall biosynthesis n=1 Tax=Humibacillus xanthopallidus TaxID=412689 RepID=A0A543PXK1_9MICO|nr:glycosyltransferase [Humibacillus xanthopallidus]TQN48808.1 glycosyltransferase involved in cell wall biosynthesis [Humibacillus xanthopallidus]